MFECLSFYHLLCRNPCQCALVWVGEGFTLPAGCVVGSGHSVITQNYHPLRTWLLCASVTSPTPQPCPATPPHLHQHAGQQAPLVRLELYPLVLDEQVQQYPPLACRALVFPWVTLSFGPNTCVMIVRKLICCSIVAQEWHYPLFIAQSDAVYKCSVRFPKQAKREDQAAATTPVDGHN